MSSIKDKLKNIDAYFRGIDYYNDAIMVKCELPEKITIIEDSTKGIKATKGEDNLTYYYANKNDVEIEDILELIENTIKVYEEAREKAMLFRQKCEELKELFANTDIESLKNLKFIIEQQKKKTTKRKKEEQKQITEDEIKAIIEDREIVYENGRTEDTISN